MSSDLERTQSPILSNIELRMLTSANFTGFVIDTDSEWNQGSLGNITVNDSGLDDGKSVLNISTPINVGGRYFAKSGSVSEINNENVSCYLTQDGSKKTLMIINKLPETKAVTTISIPDFSGSGTLKQLRKDNGNKGYDEKSISVSNGMNVTLPPYSITAISVN